jgi:hypothetical protein
VAKIEGMVELIHKLKNMATESFENNNADVAVGYSADYAIYVHENLEAAHSTGKRAKFLEEPYRSMRKALLQEIAEEMRRNIPLRIALKKAGLKLLSASKKIVPVDTGNLRNSGYVEVIV